METRVLTDACTLAEVADAWRGLGDSLEGLPHQSSFDYVNTWATSLPAGAELRVVVAEDHGELVGALPLAIVPRRVGPVRWRELVFLHEGDHRDAVVDDRRVSPSTTVKALLAAGFAAAEGVQRINLRYLPAGSHLVHHLFRGAATNPHLRPLVEIPRIELSRYDDFAGYRRTVPRSSLTSLNKLRRELGLEVSEVPAPSEQLFAELVELHRTEKQHLHARGRLDRRSLFEDPRLRSAYGRLVVDNRHAVAFVARTGEGRLAFYELAWRRGRRVWAWNTAYDPDLAQHRPSRARIAVIESLFTAGTTDTYDLGAGRYPWKFELTTQFGLSYEFSQWVGEDVVTRVLKRLRP